MNKLLFVFAISIICGCDSLEEAVNNLPTGLTDSEIVEGLKAALTHGVDSSVVSASAVDGYLKNQAIKILLPKEVSQLQNTVNTGSFSLGFVSIPYKDALQLYQTLNTDVNGDIFDELVVAMNRGAESAASKAKPIFVNALTGMDIEEGLNILQGSDTAATNFFVKNTRTDLISAFTPDVENALGQTNATSIYSDIAGFLNYTYPGGSKNIGGYLGVAKLETSLAEYATTRATDGLFHLVGKEEEKIRKNPFKWASDIIRKVFGSDEAKGNDATN